MSGKVVRLNRLFKHSRRTLIVPMDHGITIGPVEGLTNMRRTITAVADGGADAVIVHKGLARQAADFLNTNSCELIVHLSASTTLSPDPNRKELVSSVEEAIRLGATAVSTHVNLASKNEAEMLKDMGRIADKCEQWGVPLLAMMYVRDGTKETEYDPVKIRHAARIAEEMGADIIKVNYTGSAETFAEVTASVRKPVVIAGGPKIDSPESLLRMIAEALQAGAAGAAIGRNIFQDSNPTLMAGKIRGLLDTE